MCGISIILKSRDTFCPQSVMKQMNRSVAHRGPDAEGEIYFLNEEKLFDEKHQGIDWTLALGHRRLSIIDLSEDANQPMCYRDRYWITFNGEIYNYLELRKELIPKGHVFRTTSDTEVILAAYAEWQLNCFARFNGMWSIGIYDSRACELVLSRDRMGIKPLYLYHDRYFLAIGSEIKQFRSLPNMKWHINQPFLYEYVMTGYEAPNQSFFQNILPLEPAKVLVLDTRTREVTRTKTYWHLDHQVDESLDLLGASTLFRETFLSSVALRLRSDVPVGSFLSGGLDSSAIVSLMRKTLRKDKTIHTYSAVFRGHPMDESNFVSAAVDNIDNVKGHLITPQFKDFEDGVREFLWHNDEPVGGPSVFASYSVAKLANQHGAKVILNGQGGDEILGGYWQLYFMYLYRVLRKGRLDTVLKNVCGALTRTGNANLILNIPFIMKRLLSRRRKSRFHLNLEKGEESAGLFSDYLSLSPSERRIYEIRNLFLPRLLKWEDRNTMAFSIEGRYPFLDHRLIEMCMSFPDQVLYDRGWTKVPLRSGLKDELPQAILKRKSKFGFEVPQNKWLDLYLSSNQLNSLEERPIDSIIDRSRWNSLIARYNRSRSNDVAQLIFRLIFTNIWMDLYNLEV